MAFPNIVRNALTALFACVLSLPGQTMPPGKATATFADGRVSKFIKNVQDAFNVTCMLTDPTKTSAKITLPNIPKDAPPEAAGYASTYYEIVIPCTGQSAITIKAEFTTLTGDKPLNLTLSFSEMLTQ